MAGLTLLAEENYRLTELPWLVVWVDVPHTKGRRGVQMAGDV